MHQETPSPDEKLEVIFHYATQAREGKYDLEAKKEEDDEKEVIFHYLIPGIGSPASPPLSLSTIDTKYDDRAIQGEATPVDLSLNKCYFLFLFCILQFCWIILLNFVLDRFLPFSFIPNIFSSIILFLFLFLFALETIPRFSVKRIKFLFKFYTPIFARGFRTITLVFVVLELGIYLYYDRFMIPEFYLTGPPLSTATFDLSFNIFRPLFLLRVLSLSALMVYYLLHIQDAARFTFAKRCVIELMSWLAGCSYYFLSVNREDLDFLMVGILIQFFFSIIIWSNVGQLSIRQGSPPRVLTMNSWHPRRNQYLVLQLADLITILGLVLISKGSPLLAAITGFKILKVSCSIPWLYSFPGKMIFDIRSLTTWKHKLYFGSILTIAGFYLYRFVTCLAFNSDLQTFSYVSVTSFVVFLPSFEIALGLCGHLNSVMAQVAMHRQFPHPEVQGKLRFFTSLLMGIVMIDFTLLIHNWLFKEDLSMLRMDYMQMPRYVWAIFVASSSALCVSVLIFLPDVPSLETKRCVFAKQFRDMVVSALAVTCGLTFDNGVPLVFFYISLMYSLFDNCFASPLNPRNSVVRQCCRSFVEIVFIFLLLFPLCTMASPTPVSPFSPASTFGLLFISELFLIFKVLLELCCTFFHPRVDWNLNIGFKIRATVLVILEFLRLTSVLWALSNVQSALGHAFGALTLMLCACFLLLILMILKSLIEYGQNRTLRTVNSLTILLHLLYFIQLLGFASQSWCTSSFFEMEYLFVPPILWYFAVFMAVLLPSKWTYFTNQQRYANDIDFILIALLLYIIYSGSNAPRGSLIFLTCVAFALMMIATITDSLDVVRSQKVKKQTYFLRSFLELLAGCVIFLLPPSSLPSIFIYLIVVFHLFKSIYFVTFGFQTQQEYPVGLSRSLLAFIFALLRVLHLLRLWDCFVNYQQTGDDAEKLYAFLNACFAILSFFLCTYIYALMCTNIRQDPMLPNGGIRDITPEAQKPLFFAIICYAVLTLIPSMLYLCERVFEIQIISLRTIYFNTLMKEEVWNILRVTIVCFLPVLHTYIYQFFVVENRRILTFAITQVVSDLWTFVAIIVSALSSENSTLRIVFLVCSIFSALYTGIVRYLLIYLIPLSEKTEIALSICHSLVTDVPMLVGVFFYPIYSGYGNAVIGGIVFFRINHAIIRPLLYLKLSVLLYPPPTISENPSASLMIVGYGWSRIAQCFAFALLLFIRMNNEEFLAFDIFVVNISLLFLSCLLGTHVMVAHYRRAPGIILQGRFPEYTQVSGLVVIIAQAFYSTWQRRLSSNSHLLSIFYLLILASNLCSVLTVLIRMITLNRRVFYRVHALLQTTNLINLIVIYLRSILPTDFDSYICFGEATFVATVFILPLPLLAFYPTTYKAVYFAVTDCFVSLVLIFTMAWHLSPQTVFALVLNCLILVKNLYGLSLKNTPEEVAAIVTRLDEARERYLNFDVSCLYPLGHPKNAIRASENPASSFFIQIGSSGSDSHVRMDAKLKSEDLDEKKHPLVDCVLHCGEPGTISLTKNTCSHYICAGCLPGQMNFYLEAGDFPARCPGCKADFPDAKTDDHPHFSQVPYDVPGLLSYEELIPEVTAQRFTAQQLLKGVGPQAQIVGCPTCKANYIIDPREACGNMVRCVCGTQFCQHCEVLWHKGETCENFKLRTRDEKDSDALIALTSKPCPGCKVPITHYKGHACHHIKPGGGCPNCGLHFCYVCGANWTACFCPVYCTDTCGCPRCPDCRPGMPCNQCSGDLRCDPCNGR